MATPSLPSTSTPKGGKLEVWGAVRPASFAKLDTGQAQIVEIQFQAGSRGAWQVLDTVAIANSRGYFDAARISLVFPRRHGLTFDASYWFSKALDLGGNYTNPDFYGAFGPDNLTERFERKVPLPTRARGRAHYEAVDLSEYLTGDGAGRRGVFLLTVQGYDPSTERKSNPARSAPRAADGEDENEGETDDETASPGTTDPGQWTDKRLVLVTDLGILVKKALDGSQDAFVQSIHTGTPAGVRLEVTVTKPP